MVSAAPFIIKGASSDDDEANSADGHISLTFDSKADATCLWLLFLRPQNRANPVSGSSHTSVLDFLCLPRVQVSQLAFHKNMIAMPMPSSRRSSEDFIPVPGTRGSMEA